MSEGASITPGDLRAFANLPQEVPEALLTEHITIALGDLMRVTGRTEAPAGQADLWAEALKNCALASVFPWLNTFALSGAAKVGRLEGSVEYRFLDADEVEARCKTLMARFHELSVQIAPPESGDTPKDEVAHDGFTMMAI